MATVYDNKSGSASLTGLLQAGLIGGVVAAVINVVLYFIGQAAGADYIVMAPGTPPAPLPFPLILLMSVLPGLAAALLLFGLQRFGANGTRIFYGIAAVVFLLFLAPFTGDFQVVTKVFLFIMHVVVAGSVLYFLNRATR